MDNHEQFGMDLARDRMITEAEQSRLALKPLTRSGPLGLAARAVTGFIVGFMMGILMIIFGPFYLAFQCWREDAWFTDVV